MGRRSIRRAPATGVCFGKRACFASKPRGFNSLHLHHFALPARRSCTPLVRARVGFDSRAELNARVVFNGEHARLPPERCRFESDRAHFRDPVF